MPTSHRPRRRHVPKRIDPSPFDLAAAGAALLTPAQRGDLLAPVQAAPEPIVIKVKWHNLANGTEQDASTYVRLTPEDCRRIVAMAQGDA